MYDRKAWKELGNKVTKIGMCTHIIRGVASNKQSTLSN